jgi:SAM-dependent methyltransferase
LVFNNLKNDYEVGEIINIASPSSNSKILDIGCGTGHHVSSLGSKGLDILGIDISPSMIKTAKKNYPDYNFKVADALNGNEFERDSFTHILCMYFTIYYFNDKTQFFNNCFNWLMPGGYLIVHLVDRAHFDPILPPGNPLMYVSPQRYAKERITSTKVKFTDFSYSADFKLDELNDQAKFIEKFKNDSDGKVRKNELTLYMPDIQQITDTAQASGFTIEAKIDLLQCQYEYQYLYVFVKPN